MSTLGLCNIHLTWFDLGTNPRFPYFPYCHRIIPTKVYCSSLILRPEKPPTSCQAFWRAWRIAKAAFCSWSTEPLGKRRAISFERLSVVGFHKPRYWVLDNSQLNKPMIHLGLLMSTGLARLQATWSGCHHLMACHFGETKACLAWSSSASFGSLAASRFAPHRSSAFFLVSSKRRFSSWAANGTRRG